MVVGQPSGRLVNCLDWVDGGLESMESKDFGGHSICPLCHSAPTWKETFNQLNFKINQRPLLGAQDLAGGVSR